MRLLIRHVTRYAYDPPAHRAALRLKLYPPRFQNQNPASWRVSVNGADLAAQFTNGLGEGEAVWTSAEPLAAIELIAEGVIDTSDSAGVVRGLADQSRPALFLRVTDLTAPDESILRLAEQARADTPLATLHALCNGVRDAVDYTPESTAAHTTAVEALALGHGVCQDHAHVFIAAARALGVPARYVTGYLTPDYDGQHQTHAWAEAFTADLGWIGFDPANRQCPTPAYVRLCAGFDADDAAPVRGIVPAGLSEALDVMVAVEQAQQ